MDTVSPPGLGPLLRVLRWNTRKTARRVRCLVGLPALALLLAVLATLGVLTRQQHTLDQLATRRAAHINSLAVKPAPDGAADDRARLAAFDRLLPDHESIPGVVNALMSRAQAEGLILRRGDYRPQADSAGRFMRYSMSLPIQGEAAAVVRFIEGALQAHPTLGLASVTIKRERLDSSQVEARIEWVLFANLPALREGRGR